MTKDSKRGRLPNELIEQLKVTIDGFASDTPESNLNDGDYQEEIAKLALSAWLAIELEIRNARSHQYFNKCINWIKNHQEGKQRQAQPKTNHKVFEFLL